MEDDELETIKNQIDNNQAKEYLIKKEHLCKKINGKTLIV